MPAMHHRVHVEAEPQRVYEALVHGDGLAGWWTANVETDGEEGGKAVFGFEGDSVHYTVEIAQQAPGRRVIWMCRDGPGEWVGTELVWRLEPGEAGGTVVAFEHRGWDEATPFFAQCNTTWGALMFQLKGYCEGAEPGPWFKG